MPASRAFLTAILAAASLSAQQPLITTGTANVNGFSYPYTIRHLPVSSFPELPAPLVAVLARRGCLIPQSYEAHHPENVIHGSFERPGSSDWAVLCLKDRVVALMIFLESAPDKPLTLATADDTFRLSSRPGSAELGFNWAIDTVPPERVRQAQKDLNRPQRADHDAIADSVLEQRTVYRYFSNGSWTQLPLPEK